MIRRRRYHENVDENVDENVGAIVKDDADANNANVIG
jgi:hypothetical protein